MGGVAWVSCFASRVPRLGSGSIEKNRMKSNKGWCRWRLSQAPLAPDWLIMDAILQAADDLRSNRHLSGCSLETSPLSARTLQSRGAMKLLQRSRRRLVAAAVAAVATAAFARPSAAKLDDAWQHKYQGVRHLIRSGTDASGAVQRYHLALVDLTNPHVKVRAALNNDQWGGAKEVVSKMAQRHGAVVAVNGDYWGWGAYDVSQGTTAVEGTCHRAHPERSAIAFSKDLKQIAIGRFGTWPIPDQAPDDCPGWFENAIGAGPQFIFGGVDKWQTTTNASDPAMIDINGDTWFGKEALGWGAGRNPNTAVGITQDGKTLILVTCDGRGAGGADGCRMSSEMVAILREHGAHDALKLDSGGSTTFYYDGAVRNQPSDGKQRAVVDALLVQSIPLPCAADLAGGTTMIDDGGPCFATQDDSWWPVAAGEGGSAIYTWATDAAAAEASGRWTFSVSVTGPYRVEVHLPDAVDSLSQKARYRILSGDGGQLASVVVDQQAARGGWAPLGSHDFTAGPDGALVLEDNTGEPLGGTQGRRLVFDAVRLVAEGSAVRPDGSTAPADAAPATADATPSTGGPSTSPADAGPLAGDPRSSVADADPPGGCACRLGDGRRPLPALLLVTVLVGLTRVRRRGPAGR